MKSFGGTLVFFGVGSLVLNTFGYEFYLLMWIDMWGETIGWVIRGGLTALGAAIYFLAPTGEHEEEVAE